MRRRSFTTFLLISAALAAVTGAAWLSRNPEAPIVTQAREWPLIGPLVASFQDAYLGAPDAEDSRFSEAETPTVGPGVDPGTTEVVQVQIVDADRVGAKPYVWADEGTLVHSEPEAESEVVETLTAMMNLAVLEQKGDWYRVRRIGTDTGYEPTWIHLPDYEEPERSRLLQTEPALPMEAVEASADLVGAARKLMAASAREEACGPYRLVTDVPDADLLVACSALASSLDAVYAERYGIEPIGLPAETILFFRDADAFRLFVEEHSDVRTGYAGHANAARGYLALYSGNLEHEQVLSTLVHELTHLVNRRALGPALPRWLAEGLADGLGDAVGDSGLAESVGGLSEARRLKAGYADGSVLSVARLVDLDGPGFDADPVSYDYEQSAFLVRYLLTDHELAPRFRVFLEGLALGEPYSRQTLKEVLGVDWADLDRRLELWVRTQQIDRLPIKATVEVPRD